ncbi:MAG: acetyl-CoA carboxylase carboxyltransferase subunit alpha [Elusimicrobiota bacterium]|jgi:acetyl-CoA carboxylase carboxyl transferase subunit alpha|nr:acetyl-CoA carboxylase carboxyltransferase subunit alpha [Elusimicrobiota bacterium]
MRNYLDFEKPIFELKQKIQELKSNECIDSSNTIKELKTKCEILTKDIFSNLGTWEKVLLARHPDRPYSHDYISEITNTFLELHGDRLFGDDKAIIGGIAEINRRNFIIIGEQKGRNIDENITRNFGMPHPEGYRKSLRLMKLAEKFNIPVLTFIDTAGAYPGLGAEERGQAEAIAKNLRDMSILKVPIISIVIGEGGSGGALAIGVADTLAMLEYTIYSVISPEGCASILWRDASYAPQAAEALKLLPSDLKKLGIIDKIIKEPCGGAHSCPKKMAEIIKKFIIQEIKKLEKIEISKLIEKRYEKLKNIGKFKELKKN